MGWEGVAVKWMKHMTACSQDPKIQILRAEFGNEGYAVYWLILETIAGEFTKQNPSPSLTLHQKNWRKICEISPKKFRNFLFFCKKISILESCWDAEFVTISAPKLLKYGDEYSRKGGADSPSGEGDLSGHSPDPVRASTSPSPSPRNNTTQVSTGHLGAPGENPSQSLGGEIVPFGGAA